jgi:tetraacyldisaccharide 4'-kinase
MRAPAFWRETGGAGMLLAPLGRVYGALAAHRMARAGERADVPVLCVGNFTAGGAGKTPTAIALAEALRELGWRPAFLSRGYGGAVREPIRVDLSRHTHQLTGDEPLLLARHAPTVVSPDRVAGAKLAAALGDVIVMDDGLQNPALAKDLRIAVVDGQYGVGNGRCIPAGPLRAPLAAQLGDVEAVLVIGEGAPGAEVAREAQAAGATVLHADLTPDPKAIAALRRDRVFAFAGIGRPDKMFDTLRDAGVTVAEQRAFPDHHRFTRADAAALLGQARTRKLTPVTTEKDLVRLRDVLAPGEEGMLRVLPVRLAFRDPAALKALLARLPPVRARR